MKNNSVVECENAMMVLAFGSELPTFLVNEMKSNTADIRFTDDADEQTSINERCRKIIADAGYKISGTFLAYKFGKDFMAEDENQWWYIGDIGDRLAVIQYQVLEDGEYKDIFDYRDFIFEPTLRSSLDDNSCGLPLNGKKIGDERTPYVCEFIDHITNERYFVTRERVNEFRTHGKFLPLDSPAQVIAGELVRGMTFAEERLYNEDRLLALVDMWGNIALEEPSEQWIMARI